MPQKKGARRLAIEAELRRRPLSTAKEIAEATGFTLDQVHWKLREMVVSDFVRKIGAPGGNGRTWTDGFRYEIIDEKEDSDGVESE